MLKGVRCVNLDWLEVHAYEPLLDIRDAAYYRAQGWEVKEREYGTRIYREMFTLIGKDGFEILEVRRNPSSQGVTGIHDARETHIRLKNRTCYFDNAATWLLEFLNIYGYEQVRISRVDICLDFVMFDSGDEPNMFLQRYMRGKYAKINQANINAFGQDRWDGRLWNSVSWGSPSSPVSTKMYCKTLELYDPKTDTFKKPYIRQAWAYAGFIDDWQRCTKNGIRVNVWRVEFSIKSAVRNWVRIEINGKAKNYQSLRNNLTVYASRESMFVLFASLVQHYFKFKKYKKGKRKDLCKDKRLFEFAEVETFYKIGLDDYAAADDSRAWVKQERLKALLVNYRDSHIETDVQDSCNLLISTIDTESVRADYAHPFSQAEIDAMKKILHDVTARRQAEELADILKTMQSLNIKDRTLKL